MDGVGSDNNSNNLEPETHSPVEKDLSKEDHSSEVPSRDDRSNEDPSSEVEGQVSLQAPPKDNPASTGDAKSNLEVTEKNKEAKDIAYLENAGTGPENANPHPENSHASINSDIGFELEKNNTKNTAVENSIEKNNAENSATKPLENKHPIKTWIIRILVILLAFIFIRWLINYHHAYTTKTVVKPVPVVLGNVEQKNMPLYIPALGTVSALSTVTVKTQINGRLLSVLYQEGQTVTAGELIAEIDPRPYEAQLEQFQGQLARDEALLANAKIDLERYEKLFTQDSVSQQTLETQRWLVKQLEGTIKLDQGQIDAVKVNLIYTKITSPIDGVVGLRLVDPGNFVQTTDTTGLVIINTIQPINVVFSIPEDNIPAVQEQIALGKELEVQAYDRAQNKLLALGKLFTIDNQIDPTTGTVRIKARFANENKILFPNQFVNVQLKVNTLENAMVVPRSAVQYGAEGTFVFVVGKKDNIDFVSVKPIKILATVKEEVAVLGELSVNQAVVVEGADKLSEETVIKAEQRTSNKDNYVDSENGNKNGNVNTNGNGNGNEKGNGNPAILNVMLLRAED